MYVEKYNSYTNYALRRDMLFLDSNLCALCHYLTICRENTDRNMLPKCLPSQTGDHYYRVFLATVKL